jgi:hypothetical protein
MAQQTPARTGTPLLRISPTDRREPWLTQALTPAFFPKSRARHLRPRRSRPSSIRPISPLFYHLDAAIKCAQAPSIASPPFPHFSAARLLAGKLRISQTPAVTGDVSGENLPPLGLYSVPFFSSCPRAPH